MNRFPNWLNQRAFAWEEKYGLFPTALIFGLIILLCSAFYVWPKVNLEYHGIGYAELSKNIFNLEHNSDLRYRILSPFLGWLTRMKGDRFQIIPWTFLLAFLAAAYHEFRRLQHSPALAVLASAILAFSATTFIPLISPGYVDPASFLFILCAFLRIDKPIHSAICIALALLNHESVVFLIPALLTYHFVQYRSIPLSFRYLGLVLLAIIPYASYRLWINAHQEVNFSTNFYFSYNNIKECLNVTIIYAPMAAFYAFRLFWFFPLFASFKAWEKNQSQRILLYLAILLPVTAQLIIAFDSTRLFCLAFPAIIIGLIDLTKYLGEKAITRKGWILFAFNLLVIPYFVGRDQVFHLHSGLYRLLIYLVQNYL